MEPISEAHVLFDQLKQMASLNAQRYAAFLQETLSPRPNANIAMRRATTLKAIAMFAEPFFFSEDAQTCISHAGASMADTDGFIEPEIFPCGAAFWVFPKPIIVLKDSAGKAVQIRALSWLSAERGPDDEDGWIALDGTGSKVAAPTSESFIVFDLYRVDDDGALNFPGTVDLTLQVGSSWHAFASFRAQAIDGSSQESLAPVVRFILAALLFIKQKLISTAPAYVPECDAFRVRQSIKRPLRERPRVVILRRTIHTGPGGPADSQNGREYSCQWLVSGHWRQQPYPSEGAVRPKWILPYVKGPSDKPLKAPTKTVYAVVR